MEDDVRKALLAALSLLANIHERLIEIELRSHALEILLTQITRSDLKPFEEALEKIVGELRSAIVGQANEQVSAMIELLQKGKDLNVSDG